MRAIRFIPDLRQLSDRVPQTGEALRATLYLDREAAPVAVG
jgi:hypothetical protein